MIDQYARLAESDNPVPREQAARAQLPARQREVLNRLPPAHRPAACALLSLAPRVIPLRGIGKRSFPQALDVARCIGGHLTAEGVLDAPEDVFYLTAEELTGLLPPNTQELTAACRRRRGEHQALQLPGNWRGTPSTTAARASIHDVRATAITGIPASGGMVEGIVRVVSDPSFPEVEPDEIVVSATTDPSWASIMYLSAAFVVDIGDALSHAAVGARELRIRCVANTRRGTRDLRTGDHVRVNGDTGTIEVLTAATGRSPGA
jgi:pyruvate,water dikinase